MSDRSPEAIEKELEQLRDNLRDTVDELAQQLNPKTNAKRAVEEGKQKLYDGKDYVLDLVERAKGGDKEAIKYVAIGAGVSLVVLALIIRRIVK